MGSIRKRGKIWYIIQNPLGKQHWKAISKWSYLAETAIKDIEVKIAKNRAFNEEMQVTGHIED